MPLRLRSDMPELEGASTWVNGEVSNSELLGKPVLLHFWAVSCRMCKRLLPLINGWRDKYGEPCGLQVVGVHTARSALDLEIDTVMETISAYHLTHPIMIDSKQQVANTWQNEHVPAIYLFDHRLQMRHLQAGDRGLKLLEQRLHKILHVNP